MYIVNALLELCPGAEWTMLDDEYEQLEWFSEDIPKPTIEEVNAKIEELILREPMRILRIHRDKLLVDSDWTQVGDIPQSIKDLYQPYRQALRDLPENSTPVLDPENKLGISGVTWPTKPE